MLSENGEGLDKKDTNPCTPILNPNMDKDLTNLYIDILWWFL
jgi:hypothetical protein